MMGRHMRDFQTTEYSLIMVDLLTERCRVFFTLLQKKKALQCLALAVGEKAEGLGEVLAALSL